LWYSPNFGKSDSDKQSRKNERICSKEELIVAISQTAQRFIVEFADVDAADKDVRFGEKEKTPYEMLVYQIGWMDL
jgi:hypothetical protein